MIKKRVVILLVFGLFLFYSLWEIVSVSENKPEERYNISVIIRGKMDDNWENLKRGAERAAEEWSVNLRFVSAIDEDDAQEQIELLKQEAEGTDAILLSPVNHELLSEPTLKVVKEGVPVVLIESGITQNNNLPVIQSDNEGIGESLARTVVNYGNQKKNIMILNGSSLSTSIEGRNKGFLKYMKKTENKCSVKKKGLFSVQEIVSCLSEEEQEVVVALDTQVLNTLIKAARVYKKENPDSEMQIYGVGCNGEILKALENRELVSLVVEDDFSIGYLGVQEAVQAIRGNKPESNDNIRFIVTNSEYMYEEENQKLLFPFVK